MSVNSTRQRPADDASLLSTFHDVTDAEEQSNEPGRLLVRVVWRVCDQGPGIVDEFLAAIRTRIRVQKVAQAGATVRTERLIHAVLYFSGLFCHL